jgi:hypothetical protein
MADTTKPTGSSSEGTNTPVAQHGDHDRVQMLSLKADGTPDQLNPEFIGDEEQTLKATEEQFTQQAVSAADVEARAELDAKGRGTEVSDPKPDPEIKKLEQAHEKAAKAGKSAAAKAVKALTKSK